MIIPDYSGTSIVNLMSSISIALGGGSTGYPSLKTFDGRDSRWAELDGPMYPVKHSFPVGAPQGAPVSSGHVAHNNRFTSPGQQLTT